MSSEETTTTENQTQQEDSSIQKKEEILVIPTINSKGIYSFKSPFDSYTKPNEEYTCHGIRSLKEMEESDLDPLNLIYKAVNLSETEYQSDLYNNVPIIVFLDAGNNYYYIPANKINSTPTEDGIKYQELMVAATLGYIPINMDLTLLTEILKDSITETTGVTTTIEYLKTSPITIVPTEEHNTYISLLETKKNTNESYLTKYKKLEELYRKQLERLTLIEKYIANTICPTLPPTQVTTLSVKPQIDKMVIGNTSAVEIITNASAFTISSSNTNVATVNSITKVITAVSKGTTYISVTARNTNSIEKKIEWELKVKES